MLTSSIYIGVLLAETKYRFQIEADIAFLDTS